MVRDFLGPPDHDNDMDDNKDNNNQEKGYSPDYLIDEQEDPRKVKRILY